MSEPALEAGPGYVVDASVAVKLFIDDPLSERAYGLFEKLLEDNPVPFYVPDLFFIECTNVLWKYIRWGGMQPEVAHENLVDLARLRLKVTSTHEIMSASLVLAQRHSISAYDACYAALAALLGVPLVTADEKLARTLPGAVWLGDLERA